MNGLPAVPILVVDNDPNTARSLAEVLPPADYRILTATSEAEAVAALHLDAALRPRLVLLELILPDADGLIVCSNIKRRYGTPVVVCTASRRRRDVVLALKLGADDVVLKPFDVAVLEARIHVALGARRAALPQAARGPAGQMHRTVDARHSRDAFRGAGLGLTATESRMLDHLLANANSLVTKESLAQRAPGVSDVESDRMIGVCINRLRAKLHLLPDPAPHIVTVRGVGYALLTPTDEAPSVFARPIAA